jgi:phosphate-selective porin OprO and OprP
MGATVKKRADGARAPHISIPMALCLLSVLAGGAHAQFSLTNDQGETVLSVSPLIQGRFEATRGPDETTTEFNFRRAWLDTRGQLFNPDLTFRLQPDFSSGELSMRDAWVEYAVTEAWSVRMGQYTVPFALARDIGGPNRLLTELSHAANQFQVPQGRDTGVTLLGSFAEGRWSVDMGVFDGRGRLDRRDNRPATSGHLFSARAAHALVGTIPSHNATLGRAVPSTLAVGGGLQAANRNHLRDWSLGLADDIAERRADWLALTIDVMFKQGRTAISGALFERQVSPDSLSGYRDRGGEVELAHALPMEGLEAAVRHALMRRDIGNELADAPGARGWEREWGAGVNWYHDGQRWKTQAFWIARDDAEADWEFHLQHQVRF